MMDKLEKFVEKKKKLECEVKTLKETIKKIVVYVAIMGCLCLYYGFF